MFQSIIDDIKRMFTSGHMINKLIIVNVFVWLGVIVLKIAFLLFSFGNGSEIYRKIMEALMLSSDLVADLTRPWVFFTSMFLHEDLWHILWNMLFLYWFGRIVGDFAGNRRVLPLYLMGGLIGGLIFIATAPIYSPGNTIYALGASAAVMTFVVSAGALSPDYNMRLILIGDVKLKWIVLFLLLLDLLGIANNSNTGGHFAHLGGAAFGWIFVHYLRRGNDLTEPVQRLILSLSNLVSQKKNSSGTLFVRTKKEVKGNRADKGDEDFQERLDSILDKIKDAGYESLTEEEKEFLFQASKK